MTMEIINFTGNNIRLGEFPHCVDVTNIPNNHSNHGVMCAFFTYNYNEGARIMLVKPKDYGHELRLLVLKWDEQLKDIPFMKDAEIIYDSKQN